jgi:hypothetical protein
VTLVHLLPNAIGLQWKQQMLERRICPPHMHMHMHMLWRDGTLMHLLSKHHRITMETTNEQASRLHITLIDSICKTLICTRVVHDDSVTPKCTLLIACDFTCTMMSRSTFRSDTVVVDNNNNNNNNNNQQPLSEVLLFLTARCNCRE